MSKIIYELLGDSSRLSAMESAVKTLAQPVAVERIVEHVFEAAFGEAVPY